MGDSDTYGSTEFAGALGHTIKVLRTDRGIERKDLADRAGISYSHLASIEAGQKQPSPQVLTAIAEALGIANHQLLEAVEVRRHRGTGAAAGDPWWLTGRRPAAPAAMVAAPARSPRAEMAPPDVYDPTGFAEFVQELTALAEHLRPKERMVLLELARKFAQRHA